MSIREEVLELENTLQSVILKKGLSSCVLEGERLVIVLSSLDKAHSFVDAFGKRVNTEIKEVNLIGVVDIGKKQYMVNRLDSGEGLGVRVDDYVFPKEYVTTLLFQFSISEIKPYENKVSELKEMEVWGERLANLRLLATALGVN